MQPYSYNPPLFPFTALVRQEMLKLALVVSAICPGVMGVLIRGPKGTAKSTAARALAQLVCPALDTYRQEKPPTTTPFITVPVNTSDDNLVGGVDFDAAIKTGTQRYQKGLLAKAHEGFLYIDEVNLLDDHLVDLVLDAASRGIFVIERNGIRRVHTSIFVLIGTMNPEEGELRPQLLDRFGLCVSVETIEELPERIEIIKRLEEFKKNPKVFREKWRREEERERRKIERAIQRFKDVTISDNDIKHIVNICVDADVSGHRADIVIEKTARAIAAYRGRYTVHLQDVHLAASMALPHRIRCNTEQQLRWGNRENNSIPVSNRKRRIIFNDDCDQEEAHPHGTTSEVHTCRSRSVQSKVIKGNRPLNDEGTLTRTPGGHGRPLGMTENMDVEIGKRIPIPIHDIVPSQTNHYKRKDVKNGKNAVGRNKRVQTFQKRGRYIRSTKTDDSIDIAVDATLRAAAPFQAYRKKGKLAVKIEPQDFRKKIRECRMRQLLIFIVDASGSMGTRLMSESKGAIMALLMKAYQKREQVSMIAFKDDRSDILLPPTDSIDLAKKRLGNLPAGGKTPLAAGLLQGYHVAQKHMYTKKNLLPVLILITDGRANVGAGLLASKESINISQLYKEIFMVSDLIRHETCFRSLVIDTEEKQTGRLGRAKEIAEFMGANYISLDAITSKNIADAIRYEGNQ